MKSYEILDTEENIVNSYLNDTIGRNIDVNSFVDLIKGIEGGMSLSVDGKWGSGKTFFVKQTKLILDSFNTTSEVYGTDNGSKVRDKWNSYHQNNSDSFPPVVTVYYDAWAHDNEDDPLLSLIYAIMRDAPWGVEPEKKKDWKKILSSIGNFLLNGNLTSLIESVKNEDIFQKIKTQEEIKQIIWDFFASLIPEHGNTLVIFIDELDRCSPAYAIRMLERVKHYFKIPQITFVFSINPEELQHTIKKNYGSDFSAGRYLDRFFDLRVGIPPVDIGKFVSSLGIENCENLSESICKEVIRKMGFELREISRYLPIAKHAAYKITDNNENLRKDYSLWPQDMAELICLSVILPIVIGLKIYDSDQYEDFISGKNYKWLYSILNNEQHKVWVGRLLLAENECYDESNKTNGVDFEERIKAVYNAVFVKKYTSRSYQEQVGKAAFTADSKEKILRAAGLLSEYTVYTV